MKVALIASRGGHFLELYQLNNLWKNYSRFWITGKGEDTNYLLKKEQIYYGYFPEHRNILNAIRNFILGVKIILKERPSLLISTGAGIAPPIFLAGKLLGCKLIFLDIHAFTDYPSLSAKLVAPFVDKLIVQHKKVKNKLKKAVYWGSIL